MVLLDIIYPRFNLVTEGGRTFGITACQLWNCSSLVLKNCGLTEYFKNRQRDAVSEFVSCYALM